MTIKVSRELVERCKTWAKEMVAHYRSGDQLQGMPWTRDMMTLEEFERWVATREEAGIGR
jgi:hypothetical protein